MDTLVCRDLSFLGKMPGTRHRMQLVSKTICQFDASSWILVFRYSRASLANLPLWFHRPILSFLPCLFPSPAGCLHGCWPVWFLALKIYLLYKWNLLSNPRAARSRLVIHGVSLRVARTLSWYTVFEAADNSQSDTALLFLRFVAIWKSNLDGNAEKCRNYRRTRSVVYCTNE